MHHHDHAHLLSYTWDLDHVIVWVLPLALLLYAYGFRRVHQQMPDRYPLWRLASFAGGVAVVFLAVASPLHAWGEVRLYLHMTQHMLLTMVAPPLLWMGQPIVPMLRAFPPRLVKSSARPLAASAIVRGAGRAIVHPVVCWTALSAAIVVWHMPRSYELVLHSAWWHDVQHACFFGGALLFWWPVVGVWPSRPMWPRWSIIPYLVSADLINTAQSAILSFSSSLLYPSYAHVIRPEGFTALNDQMLAGVIMWVPGSIAFLLPAIALTVQLFERTQTAPPGVRLTAVASGSS